MEYKCTTKWNANGRRHAKHMHLDLGMSKWARLVGPARQPAKKRMGRVGVSNPPTCCDPACLPRLGL